MQPPNILQNFISIHLQTSDIPKRIQMVSRKFNTKQKPTISFIFIMQ